MRKGIIGSAALHAGVILASVVVWPHTLDFSSETPQAVPVELVSVAEATNIMASVTKEDLAAKPPEEPAPPAPEEAQAPPPPETAEAAPSELQPDKAKPLPEPEKQAESDAKPPALPAMPKAKPKPDAPKSKFDVDSVLALLDKRAPKTTPPANAQLADKTIKGIGAQNAMTMDIKDALLAQMRECWNIPAGAPNPEKLVVSVRVYLTKEGKLAQAPQLAPESRAAAASDPYMRAAAESALRAISVCEPYRNLPLDKYDVWREIVMVFDPSKMVGR